MELTKDERSRILTLAKEAVTAAVCSTPAPVASADGVFGEHRGCFVTLKNRGRLRGCIGIFEAPRPLGEMLVQMAHAAAREDPRFFGDPITVEELPNLDVEVSVLTPLTKTDDPAALELGVDGIYIVGANGRSGCFLPEVATEAGWDVETFLTQCCMGKAGLPADAWRDPATTVYLFRSEKF
jgi:AmmeMemoRadiSam system protein A